MKGISVVCIVTFKEAYCRLVIALVVVKESDEVCMADVTMKEGHERLRDGRTSCCVRKLAGSYSGCPGL